MTEQVDLSQFEFRTPEKKIITVDVLNKFLLSSTCNHFLQFIEELNESVKGKESTSECEVSPVWRLLEVSLTLQFVQKCVDLVAKSIALVDEVPPEDQPMRFGNKVFRQLCEELTLLRPLELGTKSLMSSLMTCWRRSFLLKNIIRA